MAEPISPQASATDIISAIAELWKLAACIVAPILIYLLREPLSKWLPTLRRFKKGDWEIELAQKRENEVAYGEEPKPKKAPPEEKAQLSPKEEVKEEGSPEIEIFDAIWDNDRDRAEALLEKKIMEEPDNKTKYEIRYYQMWSLIHKDVQAIEKLKSLSKDKACKEQAPRILKIIGEYYESTEQYEKALRFFEESNSRSVNPKDKAITLIAKSRVIASTENPEKALPLLQNALMEFTDEETLADIYDQIAEIYHLMGNKLARCVALEKVVQYRPTDTDALFKAAFVQGAADIPHLSLHNYRLELQLEPNESTARNNYAVELEGMGLSAKSVDQYCKARDKGETLSAANLAYRYLDKGLLEDAEKILREAQSKENYHGNVDQALIKLRDIRGSENKKLKRIERWAKTYNRFLRAYAEALIIPRDKAHRFEGSWTAENNEAILIEQEGSKFQFEWGNILSRRKIKGTQLNHSANIKLYTEYSGLLPTESDKPNYGGAQKALGFLSEDGSKFEILTYGKQEPQRIIFQRTVKPDS